MFRRYSEKEETEVGKKILSIEIGLHTTKVCELEAGKKNPHVTNCITFDTPENIVEDGFILDKDLMAQTLRTHLNEAKMTVKDVNITIASTKIANREVVIPLVADNKIQAIIDASASEYFPLDVSEYTISYSILDKINTKEEKKLKLLLLAAPNNLIKNIYGFAETAGLRINAIDYIGNSAYQLLKKQVGTGVNVSVQINDQTTLVNVIDNEKLALQRTIPYGAMNIVSAVIDNTVFEKTNSRDAMLLLMQENIINARLDMGGEINRGVPMASENYERMMREVRGREDVTSTIQYIMNNVNRVLDYYMSRNSEKRINSIYLAGVGAKFKGIEVLFANETGYDVKKIDNLFAVSFAKGLALSGNQADYLTAIGATIAPVGFVPEDARESQARNGADVKMMAAVFLGSCVVAAILVIVSVVRLQYLKHENSQLYDERDSKKYILDVYATHRSAREAYEYTAYMYNQTSNRNYQLNELREKIAKIMPSNMKVISLSSDSSQVSLSVEADPGNKWAIAEFIIQLNQIPSISQATVASVTEDVDDDRDGGKQSFTVVCTYNSFNAETDENITLEEAEKENVNTTTGDAVSADTTDGVADTNTDNVQE